MLGDVSAHTQRNVSEALFSVMSTSRHMEQIHANAATRIWFQFNMIGNAFWAFVRIYSRCGPHPPKCIAQSSEILNLEL